ncbi:hypothetical protein LTR05_006220 [Lithohypha guttulata]|uniref:Uncharacterized protein n=1 Tax=Lithohypha guttulata TaxID=1690604 RepID=A0AAN7Y545_9EURO|nr:hypothetical protein LTR05_006220 [Lithohypha guttulata]
MTQSIEKQLEKLAISENGKAIQPKSCEEDKTTERLTQAETSSNAKKPSRRSPTGHELSQPPPHTATEAADHSISLSRSKPTTTKSSRIKNAKGDPESLSTESSHVSSVQSTEDQTVIHKFVKNYSDRGVLPFEKYGNTLAKKYHVKKIGEGTYSSVFALRRKDDCSSSSQSESQSQSTTSSSNTTDLHPTTILKILPILLPSQEAVGGDTAGMTPTFHIASELQTMRAMDPVHGFIHYRGCLVLRGSWASSFLSAFRDFTRTSRKKALNEDPANAFSEEQYYAVIEMEDAGQELSDVLKRPSDFQSWDVFWLTTIHLANAEVTCGFEHRDLHVSNICLTIIDYTFSRVALPEGTDKLKNTNFREFVIEGKGYDRLCKDLAKTKPTKNAEEFEDRVQQLTYAKVAKLIDLAAETAAQSDNDTTPNSESQQCIAPWERHVPKSNVAWLGYLVTCLLGRAGKMAKTKYVAGSNAVAKQVQDELRKKLCEIRDVLMVEDLAEIRMSAGDVVGLGVERGWLTMEEIEAFKARLERDS